MLGSGSSKAGSLLKLMVVEVSPMLQNLGHNQLQGNLSDMFNRLTNLTTIGGPAPPRPLYMPPPPGRKGNPGENSNSGNNPSSGKQEI